MGSSPTVRTKQTAWLCTNKALVPIERGRNRASSIACVPGSRILPHHASMQVNLGPLRGARLFRLRRAIRAPTPHCHWWAKHLIVPPHSDFNTAESQLFCAGKMSAKGARRTSIAKYESRNRSSRPPFHAGPCAEMCLRAGHVPDCSSARAWSRPAQPEAALVPRSRICRAL